MSTLKDFPPCKPDLAQPDWECGPCGLTRDSEPLEQCNFDVACEALAETDPHEQDFEVLTWRHWAVGWVSEIFTRPGSECNSLARALKERLGEYPCLSDERLAEYQAEDDNAS